jgi:hypothetical protein
LRLSITKPIVAEYAATFDLMMTLVAAGYGLGFARASHIAFCRYPEIVARPLAGKAQVLTTYLLRVNSEPSDPLNRFITRALAAESSNAATES